jgi:ubiquinone/menaquinone biosynthesis C-methylase UbiE
MILFLNIVKRGYAYTGVDISKETMEEIRHKLQGIPDNLTLMQTDVALLLFENDFFDVVLTLHILQLVPFLAHSDDTTLQLTYP